MKQVHLICNAHIDPIWQWEWEEGAAAALSTFRSAADLADEFDYIFCHNEVTLYKYIAEYAPSLFSRIKELIRAGKWHIMGGWYLQPDCNMPSGESFVRQILMGHRYFEEQFGVKPTTAVNFDPFGHCAGLPQILKKCGQDSYMLMRSGDSPLPARRFLWEGVDGSRIKVWASPHGYNSPLGGAADAIRQRISTQSDDVICVLWGVGNHGGGPSRRDLADIEALKQELGGGMEILHSTPEQFFAGIQPEAIHRAALRISMPGCYTSMVRIKQKHAELEDALFFTEKLCSVAAMRGLIEYPETELDEAVEDLLNAQFHDVLPGTSVRAGEENGLRLLDHGLLILNRLRARAFFALSAAQPRARDGEYPILVFNPQPYVHETEIWCEMMLADQNWSEEKESRLHLLDESGRELPVQLVKEESSLNLDWRKRLVFRAPLKPLDITRFSVYVDYAPKKEKTSLPQGNDVVWDVLLPDGVRKHVEIDGKTGLLRSYRLNEKEYISQTPFLGRVGAFLPVFYRDNPDPWAMQSFQLSRLGSEPVPFSLMEEPDGPFEGLAPMAVIEDGAVYTAVECLFALENTKIRVEYDIYKANAAVDVKVDAFMMDANRMLKLAIPAAFGDECIGQTAFGTEILYEGGRENVAQRFVALREGHDTLAVLNRGTYGSSFEDGVLFLSLIRGATYCAHPINNRPIIPTDKFVKKMDMGERNFTFRLTVAPDAALERLSGAFSVLPYACNVFPAETARASGRPFRLALSCEDIVLITMKRAYHTEDYLLRLMNNSAREADCTVRVNESTCPLHFGRYEVKTVRWNGDSLCEEEMLSI